MIAPKKINQHMPGRNSRSAYSLRDIRSSGHFDALPVVPVDILTIDQFLATHVSSSHLAPEKILLLAVLQDAVSCFQENLGASDRRKKRSFLEANEWFMAEDTSYIFSFVNICDALNVAPSYLRRGLMTWKDTMLGTARSGCLAS